MSSYTHCGLLLVSCVEEEWPWACLSLMAVQWRACSFLQKVLPWELEVCVISAPGLHSWTIFSFSFSFPFSSFFPSFSRNIFLKIKFSVIRYLLQVKIVQQVCYLKKSSPHPPSIPSQRQAVFILLFLDFLNIFVSCSSV